MATGRERVVHFISRAGLALALIVSAVVGTAQARERPSIKSVGIISDLGDMIHVQHIGFMAFSNSLVDVDLSDWQIDNFITADLEAALKDHYDLHGVSFDKGSIRPDLEGLFWTGPSPRKNVRDHASPADGQPIDAYLVVWPFKRDLAYPSNQHVEGLGLLTGHDALLFAGVALTLVDGRTFDEIGECWLKAPMPGHDVTSYLRRADELKDVESVDAMTAAQKQAFERGMKDFLRDGLNYCLEDLKLAP